jgi:hypothetical protein
MARSHVDIYVKVLVEDWLRLAKDFGLKKEETSMELHFQGIKYQVRWYTPVPLFKNGETLSFKYIIGDNNQGCCRLNSEARPDINYGGELVPIADDAPKGQSKLEYVKEYISEPENFSRADLDALYNFLHISHNCRIR